MEICLSATIGPVVFPFTGYGVGGSHISTFLLAAALRQDHGIRTVIIAPVGSTIEQEARARGLEVFAEAVPPAFARSTLRDIRRLPVRRRILRRFGPGTIVHCCDVWSMQAWGVPAKTLGLPLVYHHRAFVSPRLSETLPLRLADRIITISQACTENLEANGIKAYRSIYNPFGTSPASVDRDDARAEWQARWPVEGLKLVGFSANFEHRKRAVYFVEAAAALSRLEPTARFIVFGRDREETAAELQALADRLGIGDQIFFAGFRSPPERNIGALDVLACPALAEPFGRTLLETALLGVPYVATDDAGHGEIARRWGGGLLVERHQGPDAFARAMHQVLGDGNVALDSAQKAAVARELFPATHAGKVIDVYRGIRSARE